jgi:hypothetical protein
VWNSEHSIDARNNLLGGGIRPSAAFGSILEGNHEVIVVKVHGPNIDTITDTTVDIRNLGDLDSTRGVLWEHHRLKPRRSRGGRGSRVNKSVSSKSSWNSDGWEEPNIIHNNCWGVTIGEAVTLGATVESTGSGIGPVCNLVIVVSVRRSFHEDEDVTVACGLCNLKCLGCPENFNSLFRSLCHGHVPVIPLIFSDGSKVDQKVLGGSFGRTSIIIHGCCLISTMGVRRIGTTLERKLNSRVESCTFQKLVLIKRIAPENPECTILVSVTSFNALRPIPVNRGLSIE